jgi:hypothetical protein
MRPSSRWFVRIAWLLVLGLSASTASALQRTVKSKTHNYKGAPVEIRRSGVTLVETFTAPTQFAMPEAKQKTSRVRYANRAGLAASVFVLNGQLSCQNTSSQTVEALSVTIVPLDAFHQPLLTGQAEGSATQQIVQAIPRGATRQIAWEQRVNSSDVFEVAVVITRVRFADGTIWVAPGEELLDVF